MKRHFGFLLLLIVYCHTKAIAQCSLPAPLPLRITNVGSCQMTVSWDSIAGASAYSVQYKLSLDLVWTVIPNVPGSVTTYTITGLASNLQYKVRVAGVCSNGIIGHFRQTSKKNYNMQHTRKRDGFGS